MMKLIEDQTGKEVKLDGKLIDFRGKEWVFQGLTQQQSKVYAWDSIGKMHREFYPSVFKCSVISSY